MIILDANILISYFNENDATYDKAVRLFDRFEQTSEHVGIPEYVLLETVNVLQRTAGKQVSDQFLVFVVDNQDVEILQTSKDFLFEVIRQYRARRNKTLSFTDVALLVFSSEVEVHTFDRNLQRALKKDG